MIKRDGGVHAIADAGLRAGNVLAVGGLERGRHQDVQPYVEAHRLLAARLHLHALGRSLGVVLVFHDVEPRVEWGEGDVAVEVGAAGVKQRFIAKRLPGPSIEFVAVGAWRGAVQAHERVAQHTTLAADVDYRDGDRSGARVRRNRILTRHLNLLDGPSVDVPGALSGDARTERGLLQGAGEGPMRQQLGQ